ncbi:MAG TPA: molybdate ABC transporter substrate-binding protein [Acidimicrobiales bacterium]|nr:molybdate ABC transporter substrate-binding protein [Acidimicrobiales bacterium]
MTGLVHHATGRGEAPVAKAFGIVAMALLVAGACASAPTPGPIVADPTASRSGDCEPAAGAATLPAKTAVHGTVRVLAAASLTGAFAELADAFEATYPGARVATSFGASSDLVARIHQGAPADVLATADTETMDLAADPPDGSRGDVATPVTLTCNTMMIITARGNPLHITSLADLARPDVRFALCAEPVPCGRLGRQVLHDAGVDARPVGSEANVKAVVAKVIAGEVDAGIVYVTDARVARPRASSVAIPAQNNVVTTYPIAVARDADNATAARAFVTFATGPTGRSILRSYGFGPH